MPRNTDRHRPESPVHGMWMAIQRRARSISSKMRPFPNKRMWSGMKNENIGVSLAVEKGIAAKAL